MRRFCNHKLLVQIFLLWIDFCIYYIGWLEYNLSWLFFANFSRPSTTKSTCHRNNIFHPQHNLISDNLFQDEDQTSRIRLCRYGLGQHLLLNLNPCHSICTYKSIKLSNASPWFGLSDTGDGSLWGSLVDYLYNFCKHQDLLHHCQLFVFFKCFLIDLY